MTFFFSTTTFGTHWRDRHRSRPGSVIVFGTGMGRRFRGYADTAPRRRRYGCGMRFTIAEPPAEHGRNGNGDGHQPFK